ncbi:DUF817 domain-containing protein [Demequina activiva]|uniref:DUF817 domain-containing protein n=1 Tax=Demequina activiva TaxID=1582364 RepID=A0A919Q6I0_9MICO|nr:DUF817 domain-containing protein [Demequina activiva]GIG55448.1 hypothetical protein Dac01nite_22000 [Demequina activiva]
MTASPQTGVRARVSEELVLLRRFIVTQLQSLVFAILLFAAMAVTDVVELPIARYDALLVAGIAITLGLWWSGYETAREVGVIAAFHLLGLALEVFKVAQGSWTYPDEGVTMVAGVPLYSGFMYAAVGSYLCQAWRRFDLRITGYRSVLMAILAVAAYLNFFTHHWIWDLRWVIALAFVAAMWGTHVHYSIGPRRLRMPLAIAFVLIGFFLWAAENMGTFLGAWQYPDQADLWRAVHMGKLGSWALLVTLSFVIIASLKQYEGTFYGHPGDAPTVERADGDDHADR